MVIHLNLTVSHGSNERGEVLEVFQSQQECLIVHDEFFNKAKRENQPIPSSFNLGCVPLKRSIM